MQATIDPDGRVHILGTHEQDLAGPHGHTFHGARFPADPAYSALLARHAHAVGQVLARRGVIGAFSLDFVVTWHPDRGWAVYALEINLRQGGTTPPLALLANLDPGQYQPDPGRWHSAAGGVRCYRSTDNLTDPRWVGLTPAQVIDAVRDAGLGWDHDRRTGVVLHLLSCLAVDGRMGLTAIAPTPEKPTPSTTTPWLSFGTSRPEPIPPDRLPHGATLHHFVDKSTIHGSLSGRDQERSVWSTTAAAMTGIRRSMARSLPVVAQSGRRAQVPQSGQLGNAMWLNASSAAKVLDDQPRPDLLLGRAGEPVLCGSIGVRPAHSAVQVARHQVVVEVNLALAGLAESGEGFPCELDLSQPPPQQGQQESQIEL